MSSIMIKSRNPSIFETSHVISFLRVLLMTVQHRTCPQKFHYAYQRLSGHIMKSLATQVIFAPGMTIPIFHVAEDMCKQEVFHD